MSSSYKSSLHKNKSAVLEAIQAKLLFVLILREKSTMHCLLIPDRHICLLYIDIRVAKKNTTYLNAVLLI